MKDIFDPSPPSPEAEDLKQELGSNWQGILTFISDKTFLAKHQEEDIKLGSNWQGIFILNSDNLPSQILNPP